MHAHTRTHTSTHALAPQEAHASGPQHLVAGRHDPVRPQRPHVQVHVRGTLAAVQKQLRTTLEVRQAGQVRAGEGHSGSGQASAWQQSGGAGGRGVSE